MLGTPWSPSTELHRENAADARDLPGHLVQAQDRHLAPPFSDDSVLTVLAAPPVGAEGGLAFSLPGPLWAPKVPLLLAGTCASLI